MFRVYLECAHPALLTTQQFLFLPNIPTLSSWVFYYKADRLLTNITVPVFIKLFHILEESSFGVSHYFTIAFDPDTDFDGSSYMLESCRVANDQLLYYREMFRKTDKTQSIKALYFDHKFHNTNINNCDIFIFQVRRKICRYECSHCSCPDCGDSEIDVGQRQKSQLPDG